MKRPPHKRLTLYSSAILALLVSGCGGSSSNNDTTTSAQAQAPVATHASTASAPARPVLHLAILSPQAGTHTGSTVTVHVALNGEPGGTAVHYRYVLDGGRSRSGASRLTFHELAPGRHRLTVLSTPGASHASTTFIVRAPARAPAPVAAAPIETHTTSKAPAQRVQSTPKPVKTTPKPAPPPPPTKTTAPEPTKTTTPETTGAIPQGNGGDGDGDNNGGPSDGDGDI